MMGEALSEARLAFREGVFPVGAVLVAGQKLVARARKTMASTHLHHAEMNLFREVFGGDHEFTRADVLTLYTTLEPCSMCWGTILHLPISRLVYAMEDPYGGCASSRMDDLPPRHRDRALSVCGGVLRNEARELFAAFLEGTSEAFWRQGGAPQFQSAVRGTPGPQKHKGSH